MAQGIIISICLLLPLGCSIYISKRYQASWKMFMFGMLAFFVTQIVLRIPLLNYLQGQARFYVFMLETIPYLLFLAITASLFEESGRWILMKYIKKPSMLPDAVMFGIGHGMIEAVLLIMVPMLVQPIISLEMAILVGLERFMAMIFHVCASLFIYKGIKDKKLLYILIAYIAHICFNFIPIYIGNYVLFNIVATEGMIAICTIIMTIITYQLIYRKERI